MSNTTDPRSIAGRVAIVTGAASGMGRATAQLFAEQGAHVAAVDRSADALNDTVALAADASGSATAFVCDLSDADAIDGLIESIRSTLGPIDIVVNNAGISNGGPFDRPDYEDVWRATFDVNLEAPMRIVRACLDDLTRNADGRVVNIASTEGLRATPRTSPYTASKHGLVGLTKALAVELGRDGVTVNAICPGPILTGMTDVIPADMRDKYARRRIPLRRYGNPIEVAHMTLSLVLPAASFLNGAIIPVDGGLTAKGD